MADEVKIVIKAVDQATGNLKSVYGSLKDLHRGVDDFISAIKDANPRNKEFADRLAEITRAYEAFEINGEDATRQLQELRREMDETGDEMQDGARKTGDFRMAWTEFNSMLSVAREGFQMVKGAIDGTVGKFTDYTLKVYDLSNALGISVDETSRLVQISDDYRVDMGILTNALEMMVKKGFEPGIESLAALADEYRAIQDPNERAAQLTELLGRNWTSLIPLLEQGGQKIRDDSKAVADSLLVTEAGVQKSKDYAKAVDDLGDAWDGFAMTIGKTVVPSLTKFLNLMSGVSWSNNISGIQATSTALMQSDTSWDAYVEGVKKAAEAQGFFAKEVDGQIEIFWRDANVTRNITDQFDLLTLAEYGQIEALKAQGREVERTTEATQDENRAVNQLDQSVSSSTYSLKGYEQAQKAAGKAAQDAALKETAAAKLNDQLASANKEWAKAAAEWSKTIGDKMLSFSKDLDMSKGKTFELKGLLDQVLGTNYQRQELFDDATMQLLKDWQSGKISNDEFKDGLEDIRTKFSDLSEPLQAALDKIGDIEWKLMNLKNMTFTTTLEIDAYINGEGGRPSPPNPRPPKPSSDYPEPYDLTPELPNTSAPYNTTYSPVLLQTRPNETVTTAQAVPAPSPVTLGPNYFTNDIEVEVLARQVAQYMTRNR